MAQSCYRQNSGADGKPSDKVVAIDEARALMAEGLRDTWPCRCTVLTPSPIGRLRHHL